MTNRNDTDWGATLIVCVMLVCMTIIILSGCTDRSTKRAVAKIASIEATSVGFGAGSESVYRLVADDQSTCLVSPGFYATVRLPARVTCFWGNQ